MANTPYSAACDRYLGNAFLAFCCWLLIPTTYGQTPPRVERISPVWVAWLSTIPNPGAYYATHDEAFAAHAAAWAATASPPYSREAFNFRPCTGGWIFNGVPYGWCHDFAVYYGGQFQYGGTTSVVSYGPVCPEGWYGVDVVPTVGSNVRRACERQLPTTQCPPDSCNGLGNPIFPEDGSKRQTEVDYKSPDGILSFSRHFHSQFGSFFHSYQTPVRRAYNLEHFAGPTPGSGTGCFVGRYRFWITQSDWVYRSHCFPYVTDDGSTGVTEIRSVGGTVARFSPSGSALDAWNAPSQLVARTVAGQPGHAILRSNSTKIDYYDAQWRLAQRSFSDGRQLTLSYGPNGVSSISDHFGRSLSFSYDGDGRLTTMTDPAGGVFQYGFESSPVFPVVSCQGDGCQRIASVTYPDLKTRTYHWNETAHLMGGPRQGLDLLTGITDESERRYSTYAYRNGLADSTERAGATLRYRITQYHSYWTFFDDPRGTARTYGFTDINGLRLLTNVSPWCPTCEFQSATYDNNGNTTSRTDFRGYITCYAHDLTRNLETIRAEGVSGVSCSTALSSAPAGARVVSTQWHPDWRLETRIAEPKKLTTITYNGQGASCAPSSVLVDGKPPAVVCSRTEQATTDESGASAFSATTTGTPRTWRYTYTTYGRVLTATDPNNRTTTYSYHADDDPDLGKRGNVATITNAANHVTSITDYNPHGQPTRIVDPNGVVTDLTYDPRLRLTSHTRGSEATVYRYDPRGLLEQATLPDEAVISYTHDAAHRLIAIADHRGNRIDYTLDTMGNRTAEQVRDPGGTLVTNIARVLDALNRVERITGDQR